MKITESRLRKIIKEELKNVLMEDLVVHDLSYVGMFEREEYEGDHNYKRMIPVFKVSFSVSDFSKTIEFICYTYAMNVKDFMKDFEYSLREAILKELTKDKVMNYSEARDLSDAKIKEFLNMEMVTGFFEKVTKDMQSENVIGHY